MEKPKDNLIDIGIERQRRTGIEPGRVRADPKNDPVARIAKHIIDFICDDAADLLDVLAALYLVARTLCDEYVAQEGNKKALELLELAQNKAKKYQLEK